MSRAAIIEKMAIAIRKADSSYFNEDYTKQASAALTALEQAGFKVMPSDLPEDIWQKAAEAMKTGRVKPEDHVKNVFETILKIAGI